MDMERLILEAMPNARKEALRNRGAMDPDDAIGIAYLTLVEIAPRFNPTRGVTFWQFARLRVAGAIKDAMRRAFQVTGTYDKLKAIECLTLDDPERPVSLPDEGCRIDSQVIAHVCVARAVRATKPRQHHVGMSGRGYAVACLLAAGWNTGDIRVEMGMPHSLMGATRSWAMAKMRRELGV
jgi:hypothetical protein